MTWAASSPYRLRITVPVEWRRRFGLQRWSDCHWSSSGRCLSVSRSPHFLFVFYRPLETTGKWSGRGSNPRPRHCERRALPAELPPRHRQVVNFTAGCRVPQLGRRTRFGAGALGLAIETGWKPEAVRHSSFLRAWVFRASGFPAGFRDRLEACPTAVRHSSFGLPSCLGISGFGLPGRQA
jgi:hypothetical protein